MFFTTAKGSNRGIISQCSASDNFLRRDKFRTLKDGAGVALDGSDWNSLLGTWTVTDASFYKYGYVYQSSNLAGRYLLSTSGASWSNFTLSCDVLTVTPQGSNNYQVAGLIFNYTDATHYWKLYLKQNTYLEVMKNIGAGEVSVESVDTPYDESVWNNLAIYTAGSAIKAYVNGTKYIDTTDANLSASNGYVGLACNESTGAFTNFGLYTTSGADEGKKWFDFSIENYNVSEDVPANKIKIPGRVGGTVQTGTPQGRTWHIEGNVTQDMTAYADGNQDITPRYGELATLQSIEYAMRWMTTNHIPLWFDSPFMRVSGVMTNPKYPVYIPGSEGRGAKISFDLVEFWENGLDD